MSSTVYIVFDRVVPQYTPDDRCALARVFFEPVFDQVATSNGVRTLISF